MFGGFPVYGSISARPALYFLGFTLINAVLLYGLYRMFKARTAAAHVPTRELAEYYLHKGKEDKAIAIYAALEMWPEGGGPSGETPGVRLGRGGLQPHG